MKRLNASLLLTSAISCMPLSLSAEEKPNVLLILADDLGYGDISCYNPQSKISTPNLDRLASNGVIFTDAHASSALSTPSRYSVLTGRYSWRTVYKQAVHDGYGEPMIPAERATIGTVFSNSGYNTACIGKWHLGWDWGMLPNAYRRTDVDYQKAINNGPTTRGFDYFFGLPASLDMSPFVFVENDMVVTVPDRVLPKDTGLRLMHGGPAGEGFQPEECLQTLFAKADEYIVNQTSKGNPFFMYLPITAPHTPVLPSEEYKGATSIGDYGDFVVMIDALIGQLVETLEKCGQADNTIIVFASDNGCAPYVDTKNLERQGHYPSGPYRGYKSDIYEGGHRIPLIVSWSRISKPAKSSTPVCLTDLFATFADLVDYRYGDDIAEDSYSFLPDILNKGKSKRKDLINQSGKGFLAFRKGSNKLIFHPGSGGWGYPSSDKEMEGLPELQFFDMSSDVAEKANLIDEPRYRRKIRRMVRDIKEDILSGRSTPGQPVDNDTENNWKQIKMIVQ